MTMARKKINQDVYYKSFRYRSNDETNFYHLTSFFNY